MTVMFAAVWLATAILALFGRALWFGITAHTLKEWANFPVTPAKRAYPTEPVDEPESTHELF
ncbi:MAG: hypothetical protein ABSG03_40970 [Bryobacteraceae bacterium]|jgi:hypothetical protein